MKEQPADIPSERVLCNKCGALILPLTAQSTGGSCMPCFNHDELEVWKLRSSLPPIAIMKEGFAELSTFSKRRYPRGALRALEKHGVACECVPWKVRVAQKGGPREIDTVRVFVHRKDETRAHLILHSYQPANPIRNCKLELEHRCPGDWDELEGTDEEASRFCRECQQKVFLCRTDIEAINHTRQGHCIALPSGGRQHVGR